jgi:hypothetical protein
VRAQLHVSERRACAALGQHRSTQRKVPRGRDDEERLTADIIELARQHGRYGYRKVAELLRQAGWIINDKRVERIWQREGLKVPHKQPKRGRLWLADGSCIRLRPEPGKLALRLKRCIGSSAANREPCAMGGVGFSETPPFKDTFHGQATEAP